jgi:hypothetical protein
MLCVKCHTNPACPGSKRHPGLCYGCRPVSTKPKCRHCGTRQAARPRGLCFPCYGDPLIRELYPTAGSKFATKGEPTEAELEQMIAEQMATLPGWESEKTKVRDGRDDE